MDTISLLGLVTGFLVATIFLVRVGIFRGRRAWGARYGAIAIAFIYLAGLAVNLFYFRQALTSLFGYDLRYIFYFRPMATGIFLGALTAAITGFFQKEPDQHS
jgi:hypothetical protein